MGKQFGKLTRIWGINYYTLSPYELKPFKGFIYPELYNTFRKMAENLPYVLLGLSCLAGIITWANEDYAARKRKNPLTYECES